MLIDEIAKNCNLEFSLDEKNEVSCRMTLEQYYNLMNTFIEESMFAFMMSYDGKFNALLAKEILEEHFGLRNPDDEF